MQTVPGQPGMQLHKMVNALLPGHNMCQQAQAANETSPASGLPEPFLNAADQWFP